MIKIFFITLLLASCSMEPKDRVELPDKIEDLKLPYMKPQLSTKLPSYPKAKEKVCPRVEIPKCPKPKKPKCDLVGFTLIDRNGKHVRMVGCQHKVNRISGKGVYEALRILAGKGGR